MKHTNKKVFFIAEIGINHNGDMKICKQLIDAAVDAGCDAVKFQKRTVDKVYTAEYLASPRERPRKALSSVLRTIRRSTATVSEKILSGSPRSGTWIPSFFCVSLN